MRVPIAFLADYALAHEDGKFYITGGFPAEIVAEELPHNLPRLSIGVRLEFQRDEVGHSFLVEIGSTAPGGGQFTKSYGLRYVPELDSADPQARPSLQFVYHMSNLQLRLEGAYAFAISIDGHRERELELTVRVREVDAPADADAPQVPEWHYGVESGYTAYAAGRPAEALAIFAELAERFPDVPVIRNNLGFVLLESGHPKEALDNFAAAARLRFDRAELLDANIGCCEYLLGNHSGAETRFIRCSETRAYYGAQSFLFGLNGATTFPVELLSAADYVALMDLNAAWAAHAAGDDAIALQHLMRAERSSLLERHKDPEDPLESSVTGLKLALSQLGAIDDRP